MVKCEICQKEFKRITQFHLQGTHGVKLCDYKVIFPEAKLESEEWLESNSKSHIGQVAWNKGLDKSDPRVMQYAKSLTGREFSQEHCQNISKAKVGFCPIAGWNKGQKMDFNPARAEAISKSLKDRKITWGDKISRVKKEQLKNKEYVERLISNITRHASSVRPNLPEQMVMAMLNAFYPNEWQYVGNCGFVLGGLIPDFMNVNGRKLLIEVFGDYWHKGENPQNRIDYFKQFGFSTLVIWEHELKNPESVEKRIVDFLSVETLHEPSLAGMKTKSDTP